MKRVTFLFILWMSLFFPIILSAQDTLPQVLQVDLMRLAETWNILDQYAEAIWPGWKNYSEVPFRFRYPNGLQMLVGHPNPLPGFDLVAGLEIRGKKVYWDRRNQIPLELKPPLVGGGGPLPIGLWQGKPVETVDIEFMTPTEQADSVFQKRAQEKHWPAELQTASENQILINIHELFHCYQSKVFQARYGNLHYNTDVNYAVYAEIEGLAIEKAYLEMNAESAKDFLKDFIVARELKRQSMTTEEQFQESEEEVREGTATFADAMTVELLKKGYQPKLTHEQDPYFFGFQNSDYFLEQKLEGLRRKREYTMESRNKSYEYGCFQALLLNRFSPGWQKGFFEAGEFLDQKIAGLFKLTPKEKEKIAERLKKRYDYKQVLKKHSAIIAERDNALQMIQQRQGRAYIVNFKPTGEFLPVKPYGKTFKVGLIYLFPEGIERVQIKDVLFQGEKAPIMQDQLYYLKWVDTDAKPDEKGYELTYSRQEGDNIFYDAVFKTRGFTISAPKIQVKERSPRVKVTVLSKIKE